MFRKRRSQISFLCKVSHLQPSLDDLLGAILMPSLLLLKHVSMVSEEDEVPLVVEGDGTPTFERRVLAEEGRKHAPDAAPQPGPKVVQNELWLVLCRPPVPLHSQRPLEAPY